MKIDSDVVTRLLCNVCNAKRNLLFNGMHLSTHTHSHKCIRGSLEFNKIVEHGTRTLEDVVTGIEPLIFQVAGRQHTLFPEAPTKHEIVRNLTCNRNQ